MSTLTCDVCGGGAIGMTPNGVWLCGDHMTPENIYGPLKPTLSDAACDRIAVAVMRESGNILGDPATMRDAIRRAAEGE